MGDLAASAVGPVCKVHKGAAPSLESNRAQRRAGGGGFGMVPRALFQQILDAIAALRPNALRRC